MEKVDLLEQRINGLISLVRAVFTCLLIIAGVDGLYQFSRVAPFSKMFATSGDELPVLTEFLFNYWMELAILTMVAVIVPITIAYILKNKQWPLVLLVLSSAGLYFFNKMVGVALFAPLIQMIKHLS